MGTELLQYGNQVTQLLLPPSNRGASSGRLAIKTQLPKLHLA